MTDYSIPTLVETVTGGFNGTRIYYWNGKYYLVDGEFDCRLPGSELARQAWGVCRDIEEARKKVAEETYR